MKTIEAIQIKLDEKNNKIMLKTECKQMKIEETVVAWDEMLSFEMDFLEQLINNKQDGEQKVFCLNTSTWIVYQAFSIILPFCGIVIMIRTGHVIVESSGRNEGTVLSTYDYTVVAQKGFSSSKL